MNQNPGSVQIVVNEDGGRNPEKQFAKRPVMILSAMQIILGIISIICEICLIVKNEVPYFYRYQRIEGLGIYCGIIFVLAGILGIVASLRPTNGKITAFTALCIIASLLAATQFLRSAILLLSPHHASINLGIMAAVALAEGIIAIVCSALCCTAFCCSNDASNYVSLCRSVSLWHPLHHP